MDSGDESEWTHWLGRSQEEARGGRGTVQQDQISYTDIGEKGRRLQACSNCPGSSDKVETARKSLILPPHDLLFFSIPGTRMRLGFMCWDLDKVSPSHEICADGLPSPGGTLAHPVLLMM